MQLKKIEKPKVFISYAWNDAMYTDKVMNFAKSLMDEGIDVVLDKYELKEGNDTLAFMEQSVNNKEITNVLMLLDETYKTKADKREGGVGAETQVISTEIYNKTEQNKFIPIIFQKGSAGEIFRPAYLKSTFYLDLADAGTYNDNFKRLVRRLFGQEVYQKPILGHKPEWVDKPEPLKTQMRVSIDKINDITDLNKRKIYCANIFNNIKNSLLNSKDILVTNSVKSLEAYQSMQEIRNELLYLYSVIALDIFLPDMAAKFYEEIYGAICKNNQQLILCVFGHETFIYLIGILLKMEGYHSIDKLLNRSYYFRSLYSKLSDFTEIRTCYWGNIQQVLTEVLLASDHKRYYSPVAELFIRNINSEFLSKDEFIFSDQFLTNYCFITNINNRPWFPETYIYVAHRGQGSEKFMDFANKLRSKRFVDDILPIFNMKIDDFKICYDNFNKRVKEANGKSFMGYAGLWEGYETFVQYTPPEDLYTLK